MKRKLLMIAGIPTALVPMAMAATALAVPSRAVTTSLSFFDPPGIHGFYQGELRARFRAAPRADGAWSIEAVFRPHSLIHTESGPFSSYSAHVQGTASAVTTILSGVATQIVVPGLYNSMPSGGQYVIAVTCTFMVGDDGVVTVQSLSL
jgi:hypothetical protein